MSTQTEQTSGPVHQQGSHFFVMTVDKPGLVSAMRSGSYTPRPGATRMDVFNAIYDLVTGADPNLYRANVVFFSLDSNQL